uniref:N-acetylserotonin methyltransferase n=1 Tax=Hypericum androsaemum TaxID=140968 RepID=A0A224X490_HYPAN
MEGENEREILEAQNHVWNHILSLVNSMSLKCAVQLGIPDIIHKHGKPMSPSQLATALAIHPSKAPCVHRLMRFLVHSGFFKHRKMEEGDDSEGGYVLTGASKLVLKDNPLSAAPQVLAILDRTMLEPWHHLHLWFRNDDASPFATAHGSPLWEFCGEETSVKNLFNEVMDSDSRLVSRILTDERHKGMFEGMGSLVDVGGGTGTISMALADAFPDLTCTVLDLPHVVADLEDTKNLKFVGGDMFVCVPPADAVMLKWVLHDWNDEDCVKILDRCKESIENKEGGKVMVIDMVLNNKSGDNNSKSDKQMEVQLFYDMQLMTVLNGQQRTEEEWAKLFDDAGFSRYKISNILGVRSVIELFH